MTGRTISHYQIIEKLGEGGMGVVYKARDTHLGRFVAIKVLPAEKVADPQRKARFVQEAKAASALNHPNIITIHDIAEAEGTDFIVMEYVSGKTLDELIGRSGLKLRDALKYGVQIADALSRAHTAGIVHRDLKPGNIMVDDHGLVKVLDFGLAKLAERSGPEDETATMGVKTDEGTIVGTASYMSPEQAEGKAVDARSDIFSFGAVLYEMVTGQRAFKGDSKVATLAAIIKEEPAPLAAGVPHDLQRLITRCLRKELDRRFQHMADVRVALAELREESDSGALNAVGPPTPGRRWAWAVAALVVLAAAGVFVWQRMQAKPLTERDWIVLADFTNTTGDPVFDAALKQALSASLNQSPYLNVLPDERVAEVLRQMERSPEERVTGRIALEVCQRAGVKALLTGSIAAVGSHYSIGLDAANCRTGDTLAQEQLEAGSKDQVLGVLGQAATRMRRKLGESLASIRRSDVPMAEATTSSLEALKAYSLGREQHTTGRNREAMPFYRRAIEIDPNFAMAYQSLSAVHGNAGERELSEQFSTKAFELSQRASERERLRIEWTYHRYATRDLDKAAEVARVWAQTYPRDSEAFNARGVICNILGQPEKAAELFREAVRLSDGASAPLNGNLARTYLLLNRFAEARALSEQLAAKFDVPASHDYLYQLAWIEGDAAAMQRQVEWYRGKPGEYQMVARQADVADFGGQLQKSGELRRRAVEMARRDGQSELPADRLAAQAVQEALVGHLPAARETAARSLDLARNRTTFPQAAVALALAGSAGPAQRLVEEFFKQYPRDTLLKNVSVPSVQAAAEIYSGNPRRAVELLESATTYELGVCAGCRLVLPLRGQAYLRAGAGKEAAAAFQKILDHRGLFLGIEYPLAYLGLGRAQALAGNTTAARKAYQDFLALWKDADADTPILKEAKQEYAKLK